MAAGAPGERALAAAARRLLGQRRLLIATNRGPVTFVGAPDVRRGGLTGRMPTDRSSRRRCRARVERLGWMRLERVPWPLGPLRSDGFLEHTRRDCPERPPSFHDVAAHVKSMATARQLHPGPGVASDQASYHHPL